MPDAHLTRLSKVRDRLLQLHKALLDAQRMRYERLHGEVGSKGQFLQLVISDPAFDWLHRFSELVVEIDEASDADEAVTEAVAQAFLDQTRKLVGGEGNSSYRTVVQSDQHASTLRRELMQLLDMN